MRTAILTFALSFSVVACGPGTLKIGEGDGNDGWVDTDGDGVPDSPDSDGDGIPDSEDEEPDIPNDDEEEEEPFPYTGEYEGGLTLQIWDMGDSYCHQDGAEFHVQEDGELGGEGWCYNDWYEDEVTLEYSGRVSEAGTISGSIAITMWLRTGGHGGWKLETVEVEMDGLVSGNALDIEFEGEIDASDYWSFDLYGESWGEK
jgi:hypothetical protein